MGWDLQRFVLPLQQSLLNSKIIASACTKLQTAGNNNKVVVLN